MIHFAGDTHVRNLSYKQWVASWVSSIFDLPLGQEIPALLKLRKYLLFRHQKESSKPTSLGFCGNHCHIHTLI